MWSPKMVPEPRRHYTAIVTGSAAPLGAFGLLLALNQLTWLTLRPPIAANAVGAGWLGTSCRCGTTFLMSTEDRQAVVK